MNLQSIAARMVIGRERLETLLKDARETRDFIVANRAEDPVAAAYLINLYDQRIAVIVEAVTAHTLMIAVISHPEAFDDPKQLLKDTMREVENNLTMATHLGEECMKIAPGVRIPWVN